MDTMDTSGPFPGG